MHPPNDIALDRDYAARLGIEIVNFNSPIPRGTRCHYCGELADTRDHIVTDAQGGRTAWWNLVPACARCNQSRGNDGIALCSCEWCLRAVALFLAGYRRTGQPQQAKPNKRRYKRRNTLSKRLAGASD